MRNLNLPQNNRPPLTPEKKKLILSITGCSILTTIIYFGVAYGINLGFISLFLPVVYWIAFAVFILVFIIYNRAFTRKNLTVDMLPAEWSKEKKESYIADGKNRLEKSKWMISVIIPIAAPIALDLLYNFTLPTIQNLLGIK